MAEMEELVDWAIAAYLSNPDASDADVAALRVCLGALLRQWSDDVPIELGPFLDEIKRRLLACGLSREVHWYRTFVAVGEDRVVGHDALLDNDPWRPASKPSRAGPGRAPRSRTRSASSSSSFRTPPDRTAVACPRGQL